MKAIELKTEFLKNPAGIDDVTPRFFWKCEGGIAQTAYRIVCWRGPQVVWDTGKVGIVRDGLSCLRRDGTAQPGPD